MIKNSLLTVLLLVVGGGAVLAETSASIDPNALIERILAVNNEQREQITDLTLDAEMIEAEKDGEVKARYIKKIYMKRVGDTILFREDYLEYYKDDELQSEKECEKIAREKKEKAEKRKARNISNSIMMPFAPEQAGQYDVEYKGVTEEPIEGYICHHFTARAIEEDENHINGEYYFDAQTFHLVRIAFSPAKLVKKTMFKLKELTIAITYAPDDEGLWLPRQADVQGKGKAMFLIGVNFSSTEYYRNPVVNSGLPDELFEGDKDDN